MRLNYKKTLDAEFLIGLLSTKKKMRRCELFSNKLCHNYVMSKLIQLLAVWILVFALPMQGYAAATMMNCEQSHSHETASSTKGHNPAIHDEGINHEFATHQHVADATDNHAKHHSPLTKHTCTACSVCCTSTAIVTASLSVPSLFDNNKVKLTYTSPQFTSFVSAGLERPPRFILI